MDLEYMMRAAVWYWLFFGTVTAKSDDGDDVGDFAFNLISDLAPLLSLFGERFAAQFMSEAISWVDCAVFAFAPLGIITMVVGAIRVGGPPWLKSLIGRARETFAVAEMETMSSTSHEVCECWNGRSIVRVMGRPRMLELLFLRNQYENEKASQTKLSQKCFGLHTIDEIERVRERVGDTRADQLPLTDVEKKKSLKSTGPGATALSLASAGHSLAVFANTVHRKNTGPMDDNESMKSAAEYASSHAETALSKRNTAAEFAVPAPKLDQDHGQQRPRLNKKQRTTSTAKRSEIRRLRAPNLSLNVSPDRKRMDLERNLAALLGLICQSLVVAVAAMISYFEPWAMKDKFLGDTISKQRYSFPLTALGTVAVFSGLFVCAKVVERASTERVWRSNYRSPAGMEDNGNNSDIRCMWLQGNGTINDQTFDSWVITCRKPRESIFTSERCDELLGIEPEDEAPLAGDLASPTSWDDQNIKAMDVDESSYRALGFFFLRRLGINPKKPLEAWAVFGAVFTILGFIIQFVGIRGSHYVVAILNLAVTLVMTIVRAYLRRSLSIHPVSEGLLQKHELDWFATRFINDPENIWDLPKPSNNQLQSVSASWTLSRFMKRLRMKSVLLPYHTENPPAPFGEKKKYIPPPTLNFQAVMSSSKPTNVGTDNQPSDVQKVVHVRQRLQHLAGSWDTPATKFSRSVARAIQEFMSKIYEEKAKVKPFRGDSKLSKREITWDLPCRWNETSESVTLKVQKGANDKWRVNSASIEAVLSLWLYSIEVQYLRHMAKAENNSEFANVDYTYNDDVPLQGTHMRVLSKYSEGVKLALGWWVERDGKDTVMSYEFSQDDLELGFLPGEDIRKSRILGFAGRKFTKDPSKPHATEGTDGVPNLEQKSRKLQCLVSPTRIPIVQLLAQHIFTSFMWSVVDDLQPLRADIPRLAPGEEIPAKPKVQSEILRRFVNSIATSTELGTVEEIYLCMIPPLSRRRKLSEADCVIEHAHLQADVAGYESHNKWRKAGFIYQELYENAIKFGSRTEIGIKMTVVLSDFFSFLTMKIRQTAPDGGALETIKDLQKMIRERLAWADKDVLRELIDINTRLVDPIHRDLRLIELNAEPGIAQDPPDGGDAFGRNEYHKAARDMDISSLEVAEAAEIATELNERDYFNRTPIHYFILSACSELSGDDASSGEHANERERAKLSRAETEGIIGKGSMKQRKPEKTVEWFCERGANLLAADNMKCTPLHYASAVANNDTAAIVRILLQNSSSGPRKLYDIPDKYGRTPLHYSAERGCSTITQLLLRFGADRTSRNDVGMLPVHSAAVRKLQDKGSVARKATAEEPHEDLTKMLDELKVDHGRFHVNDYFGRSPLVLALLGTGTEWAVRHILRDFDGKDTTYDKKGWNALHHAAKAGKQEFVEMMVEASRQHESKLPESCGTSFEQTQKSPNSLLTHETTTKMTPFVLSLSSVDFDGLTPIDIAIENGNTNLIKYLYYDRGLVDTQPSPYKTSPLHLAISKDNFEAITLLLDLDLGRVHNDMLSLPPRPDMSDLSLRPRKPVAVPRITLEDYDGPEETLMMNDDYDGFQATSIIDEDHEKPEATSPLLEARDNEGRRAIDLAAELGKMKALEYLLVECSVKPNGDHTGEHDIFSEQPECCRKGSATPLHYATKAGHADAIILLRKKGAFIEAKDEVGFTPLLRATYVEKTASIAALLKTGPEVNGNPGADPNAKSPQGRPALFWSYDSYYMYSENDTFDATRALLKAPGINVDATDPWNGNQTLLMIAARENYVGLVRAYLDCCPGPFSIQSIEPALFIARERNNTRIVAELQRAISSISVYSFSNDIDFVHKASPDQRLLRAVEMVEETQVETLLKEGANPIQVNTAGYNSLHLAAFGGYINILNHILDSEYVKTHPEFIDSKTKSSETALHIACKWKSEPENWDKVVVALLKNGASPTITTREGNTVLHLVVQYRNEGLTKLLMKEAKERLDLEKINEDHHTALWIALSNYHFRIADMLLENGADICTTNRHGLTIWHKHAKRGQTNILRVLKKVRGDENQCRRVHTAGQGQYHGTPLQVAVLAGEAEFVDTFLEIGADRDASDINGWTPQLCLQLSNDEDIYKLVLARGLTRTLSYLEEIKIARPTGWCESYKPDFVHLRDDGLTVDFPVYPTPGSTDRWVVAGDGFGELMSKYGVQANAPFPPYGKRYFEFTIEKNARSEIIGIGVCNGLEEISGMPGWRSASWGWHGDDGLLFHDAHWGEKCSGFETYKQGDTVGCGLDRKNRLFFTKNGKKLGETPFGTLLGQLFPIVRMVDGGCVRANFEGKFKYTLDEEEDVSTLADLEKTLEERDAELKWKEETAKQMSASD